MELNDKHNKLAKQEQDIEGLEPEEEIIVLSGDETDSYSENEWDLPVEYNTGFFQKLNLLLQTPSPLGPDQRSCLDHIQGQLQSPVPMPLSQFVSQMLDRQTELRESLPQILELINGLS